MDPKTVRERFRDEVASILEMAICKAYGWKIEICPEPEKFLAYALMGPKKDKNRKYALRIVYDDYPQRAPSYVFVDINTKQESDNAWPPNIKHSGPPPGICTPGTREFHEHSHKNDATYPWNPYKYGIITTLQRIQVLMERLG